MFDPARHINNRTAVIAAQREKNHSINNVALLTKANDIAQTGGEKKSFARGNLDSIRL